jgi:hypothetical protein
VTIAMVEATSKSRRTTSLPMTVLFIHQLPFSGGS